LEKGYLNIEELSEYLGIKKSTLYAKVAKRQVPFYKIDRLIRFKKIEIDRWVESLRQEPIGTNKKAREILKGLNSRKTDANSLVKDCIEQVKRNEYNPVRREPDHFKGLRKEAKDGTL
jgi:excisionase family DNA binding protein